MAWLVAVALLLDFTTTVIGLSLGLPEAGPVATRLMSIIGIAYFTVEATIIYTLYRVLAKRIGSIYAQIAALGPWLAAWHNIIVLAKGGVVWIQGWPGSSAF